MAINYTFLVIPPAKLWDNGRNNVYKLCIILRKKTDAHSDQLSPPNYLIKLFTGCASRHRRMTISAGGRT
jgi:hypothetical protein